MKLGEKYRAATVSVCDSVPAVWLKCMANLTCRQPLLKSVANNDTESIHCTSDRFLRGLAYPSQAVESWRDVCIHTLNLSAAYVSSYTPSPLARARRLLINNSWKLMNWWWKSAGRGRDLTEDELTWNRLRSGPQVPIWIFCARFSDVNVRVSSFLCDGARSWAQTYSFSLKIHSSGPVHRCVHTNSILQ